MASQKLNKDEIQRIVQALGLAEASYSRQERAAKSEQIRKAFQAEREATHDLAYKVANQPLEL